jgi:hypothetical protein
VKRTTIFRTGFTWREFSRKSSAGGYTALQGIRELFSKASGEDQIEEKPTLWIPAGV